MIRFILADLRLHAIGALVVVLLIGSATALGMAVRIEERALRLGSAHAADRSTLLSAPPAARPSSSSRRSSSSPRPLPS